LERNQQRLFVSSYLLVLAFIFCGCASGSSQPTGSLLEQPAGFQVSPSVALLEVGQTVQFIAVGDTASLINPVWKVNGVVGGSVAVGTITSSGIYIAPSVASTERIAITTTNLVSGATSAPGVVSFFSPQHFAPGSVTPSNNPQVALYSIAAPVGATVQIQFGTSTGYGLTTWAQPASTSTDSTGVLVAGMRANTTYHMAATLHLAGGQQLTDGDRVFTTGDLPADVIPSIAIHQAAEAGAAPGIDLMDLFTAPNNQLVALATDLAGNVIWYYKMEPGELPFPIKPLPNGHMLVVAFPSSTTGSNEVREIDLAGNIIYRLSATDINAGLTMFGAPFQAATLHHDILKLPNGHLIILASDIRTIAGQSVIGDAVVDWNPQTRKPEWIWSTFDHIPLTHAPYGIADWTHSNALVYSADDGNLILSMRNQNWIVKIKYQDGAGDGSILWRLGPGGDFILPNGQAPIEWNYGQHYPTIVSPNSAGIFDLMFFNNGNGRMVDADNDVCGTTGFLPCYSSIPVFELNEIGNTARVLRETNLAPHYSICCGDALALSNGNIEYDVAFDVNTPNQSFIQEVTEEQSPHLVWQMNVTGQLMYRGFRIPSLYPGVQWSQDAIAAAHAGAGAKLSTVK
jgi:arylsulfate sulfotransferase